MEEKDEWVFYKDIDWDCPKNNRFSVDTRDFHSGYHFSEEQHKDIRIIQKYDHFFCTRDEVVKILDRLFDGSGGKGGWRCLILKTNDRRFKNWSLKYLRIYRTDKGFIICDSEHKAINKNQLLSCEIDQELLGKH